MESNIIDVFSGSWKSKTFKKYNFDALGVMPAGGHLHPLMKVRSEFRQIFFQMGFTEMPTNRYVFVFRLLFIHFQNFTYFI